MLFWIATPALLARNDGRLDFAFGYNYSYPQLYSK